MDRYKIAEFSTGEIVLYKQADDSTLPWIVLGNFDTFTAARKHIATIHEVPYRVIKSEIIDIH